jgi:MFS family permease
MAQGRPNWRVLGVYLAGVFLGALDTNVVGPVFPLIARGFRVSLAWVGWTVTAYTVAYVASTVLAGGLGDRYGHRRLFASGVAAFGAASALALVSRAFWVFLLARALQGAGAGAVYPNAQAEGVAQFPAERRGLALGVFGAAFGVAAIVGPNVGGLFGQLWGWRSLFALNLPLAAIALALAARAPAARPVARAPLPDAVGGLAFAGMLALALLGLAVRGPRSLALLAGAVALAAVFAMRQRRSSVPFLDPVPFARPSGAALVAGAALIGLDMSAAVFVPTFAQEHLGFSVLGSGAALMPAAVSGALLAGAAGVLVDRVGPRLVLQVGLLCGVLGGVLLAWPGAREAAFFGAMVAFGVSTAFTMGAPLNRLALGLYRDEQAGEALAVAAVFRSVGLAAGPVLLTLAQAWHGFTGMFGAVALAALLGCALFGFVPDVRPAARARPEPARP